MRTVALSFACNNACVFCAQGDLRESSDAIDGAAAIEDAARSIVAGETLAIVGGEPTLEDRLPEWIRALDAAGAGKIVVQTNARRLAYRSYASALRATSPRLSLDVSIAGSTEAMHDYHTGTPGSFKQTVLGLRNARAEKLRAVMSCVVTRSNFRHLAEIVRLAHAVGVTGLRFVLAQPVGRALDARDRVVPAPEMVAPYLGLAQVEATKLRLEVKTSARGAAEDGAAGVFAGLGQVETESDRRAASASGKGQSRRSLPLLGRPMPGRQEERTSNRRKTGDDLRAIFPTLFEGAEPRDIAEVVAQDAASGPAQSRSSGGREAG